MNDKQELFDRLGLRGGILLAPIAGYTDAPFRRICVRHGAALVVSELISAEGIVRSNKKTGTMLDFSDMERPLAIQIFGNDPVILGEAAAIVETRKPEIIDINMGCPARKVVSSGSGSAILKNPLKVRQMVEAVVRRVTLPVSVKMRIGWSGGEHPVEELVKAVEDGGASFVTVHGRTREQMYEGKADWEAIARAVRAVSIPVIGNGDIGSFAEARERLAATGCAAVMIGRGALGNPWIFTGKIPSARELFEVIREHVTLMEAAYGSRGLVAMRKHLVRYIHDRPGASGIRGAIMARTTSAGILELLEGFLLG